MSRPSDVTGQRVAAVRVTDLPEPWCAEPYLLGDHAQGNVVGAWVADDGLVAVLDGLGREPGVFGIGARAVVAGLLTELVREAGATGGGTEAAKALGSARYATLVRGTSELLAPATRTWLGMGAERSWWDWMWTGHPLGVEDTSRAERLPRGPATDAEVGEFLSRGHPTASTTPDDRRLIGWWGVRDGGRLVATVGAIVRAPGMAPHLVSLGVDPELRGQGLAGIVMAAAVRDCLDVVPTVGVPMVSLGLYAHNDVARRVYARLGFELRHEFASWALQDR